MAVARLALSTIAVPVSHGSVHVRDRMTVDRFAVHMIVALLPCIIVAFLNTGYQANLALAELGREAIPGWRGAVLQGFGIGHDASSLWANAWHGGLHFLPVLAMALVAGHFWEWIFAKIRGRRQSTDVALIALLFALSLPPTVPLWQVGLGMTFGLVVGKLIFGGTGRNFMHPALVGLVFLYTTYPQQMVGETAWTVVEGFTGATGLNIAAGGGLASENWAGTNWMLSFLGAVPGTFGATSVLACLLGAGYLIVRGVVSARVIVGALAGMIAAAVLFKTFVGDAVPLAGLSWHWHLTLGSFVFGVVFLATDPATSCMTNTGRWIYGLLIGSLVIVIRVANVAHPDGVMFAILFANMAAPLIDHVIVWSNIRRRARRNG